VEPVPGQQLGQYRIEKKIGQGGMGAVYLATDVRLDRQVAVKVLTADLTADEERRQRFRQEATLAAALTHPNIATVHDIGEQDGATYMVMEYVRGEPLRELIGDEPLSVERTLDVAAGIAAGLARAHREGILHRDLKPDNVVLTTEGIPKILDFGLGKLIGESGPAPGAIVSEMETMTAEGSPYVTRAGQILGTLAYMSPEQVQGRPVDARTDVFSFGVLLYEMLAAERPFVGESNLDTVSAILRDEPAPLGEAQQDVPRELQEILARCLAKEPHKRFPSGQELYEAIATLKRRLETPEAGLGALLRRPGPLVAVGLLPALIVTGLLWFLERNSRVSWARNEALPEIDRLLNAGDADAAFRLLLEASEIIPDDPYLGEYFQNVGIPLDLDSDPPGATVYVKGYDHPEREWIHLGETPLEGAQLPVPARFRVEKHGYVTFEGAPFDLGITFRLFTEDEIPPGMVHVPAGRVSFRSQAPVQVGEFWLDRYEVTNREYKAFIDDGGYRDDRFWEPEADRSLFVDSTGRPGPAGWSLGAYPEGEDELPVGGVSWFEASAFAAWAGKSLPTVFHWRRAAEHGIYS
jgi:serine/threonine protein kinase